MQNYAVRLTSQGAEAFERDLKRAGATGEEAMRRIGRSAKEANGGLRVVEGGFGRLGGGSISNVAFQLGDFATQVGSGTQASVALGQQLPQLLGGLGPLGAVMGAVAAIAIPLGAAFLGMGDNAATLEDRQKALETAIGDVDAAMRLAQAPVQEIIRLYGEATVKIRELIAAKGQLALDDAAAARNLSTAFEEFADQSPLSARIFDFGARLSRALDDLPATVRNNLTTGVVELVAQLDLSVSAAEELQRAIIDVRAAEGYEAQADALARVRALLDEQRDAYGQLPEAAAELYRQVVDTEDGLRRGLASTEALEGALSGAAGMAGTVDGTNLEGRYWAATETRPVTPLLAASDATFDATFDATVGHPAISFQGRDTLNIDVAEFHFIPL